MLEIKDKYIKADDDQILKFKKTINFYRYLVLKDV